MDLVNYWHAIADDLRKAGWTCSCLSAVTREGLIIWVAEAHRGDGKRFVVHADEQLTALRELEAAIRKNSVDTGWCRY
jgi:hypothetical protein